MDTNHLRPTLQSIVEFYNGHKFGYEGNEGYRKSTDLCKLVECIQELRARGFVKRKHTIFADLGCADGRVNVVMSYFVKQSIGIEIDSDILGEYSLRKRDLLNRLRTESLPPPPDNIYLFQGSSLEDAAYEQLFPATGMGFTDIDLFYTYITLHDVFAEKIAAEAKSGALYMVYGFNKILPQYAGLKLVNSDIASQGIAALYKKEAV